MRKRFRVTIEPINDDEDWNREVHQSKEHFLDRLSVGELITLIALGWGFGLFLMFMSVKEAKETIKQSFYAPASIILGSSIRFEYSHAELLESSQSETKNESQVS